MSKGARSIFVFGVYIIFLGLALMIVPNFLIGTLSLPSTNEVWIRILGMLVGILGYYYIQAARNELTPFFKATVYGRASVILFLTAFVLLDFSSPPLILFGVVDLAGAIWTHFALRS